jgi:hypothetical protein
MPSDPTPPPSPTPEIRGAARLRETRYSLPELLSELQLERNSGSFAMEKLNQAEIGKMFDNLRKRRAKKI